MKWLSFLLVLAWITPIQSQPSFLPPFNFRVDSVSLLATWESPKIVLLDEDFEAEAFPPSGWTATSLGTGWQRVISPDFLYWSFQAPPDHFALVNDDLYYTNNGSMDYLVTPILDLTVAESFFLHFDSYFDGGFGQRAWLEYSLDSGATWQLLQQLDASLKWEEQVIDLSSFSGAGGESDLQLAFHANDYGYCASGWAIDNIYVYSDDISQQPLDYKVFLDDDLITQTSNTSYQYSFGYNSQHNCGILAYYPDGESDTVRETIHSYYLPKPENLVGVVPDYAAILVWNPPTDTNFLLGFIIYKNADSLGYTLYSGEETCTYIDYLDWCNWFGCAEYEVSAIYDLAGYGFPGETGESLREGPAIVTCPWWLELDFLEDWSTGSFSSNGWCISDTNWMISSEIGNNAPAAVFDTDSLASSYESFLKSYQFFISYPEFPERTFLSFDLLLSSIQSTGNERLELQVYNIMDDSWNPARTYSNSEGSFGWVSDTLDISNYYIDHIFSIRFKASGEYPSDIEYWAIDNISLRLSCKEPENLQANLEPALPDTVRVTWEEPAPTLAEWWQWDDGVNYTTIGSACWKNDWFAYAIRWSPEQLAALKDAKLTAIGFIPGEGSTFYKIAAWKGEEKELIYSQPAGNLIEGQWNTIILDEPIQIDITQDLLVGLFFAEYWCCAASADNGPAIDGFGNLMKMPGSDQWQTLLEINPDFDFNWNIKAFFQRDSMPVERYEVYRSMDGSNYELLAELTGTSYLDPDLTWPAIYCYAVKAVYPYEVCISGLSEEDCITLTEMDEQVLGNGYSVLVYPNPARDWIRIESRDVISCLNPEGDVISIAKLLNSNGQVIWEKEINACSFILPLVDYPEGVYLLRIETGKGVVSKKVVVMR